MSQGAEFILLEMSLYGISARMMNNKKMIHVTGSRENSWQRNVGDIGGTLQIFLHQGTSVLTPMIEMS